MESGRKNPLLRFLEAHGVLLPRRRLQITRSPSLRAGGGHRSSARSHRHWKPVAPPHDRAEAARGRLPRAPGRAPPRDGVRPDASPPSAGRRPHLARGLPRPLRRHGARLGAGPAPEASSRPVGWRHGRAALLLPAFPPSERTPGSASQKRARARPASGRKCAWRRRKRGPRTVGHSRAETTDFQHPGSEPEKSFHSRAFLPTDQWPRGKEVWRAWATWREGRGSPPAVWPVAVKGPSLRPQACRPCTDARVRGPAGIEGGKCGRLGSRGLSAWTHPQGLGSGSHHCGRWRPVSVLRAPSVQLGLPTIQRR